MSADDRKRLMRLIEIAVQRFASGDWLALGTHTGSHDLVTNHDRLLRSLRFNDDDYAGNAHQVMLQIVEREHANLAIMEDFFATRFEPEGVSVSTAPSRAPPIVFTPAVFEVPQGGLEPDLVAAMMPFSAEFEPVFSSIASASQAAGFRCLRARDIWEHAVVIQDVFSLIFRAHIVVCDFTGKNPNVFYEAGIAHTLGKHVIPITQSEADIPFDLRHHRYLGYLNNNEGRSAMAAGLAERMRALHPPTSSWNVDGGTY